MTLMNKLHLQTRRGIMPAAAFGSVVLYRMNAMDEIIATRKVENAEIRWPSRRESPGQDKPGKSRARVIHLWVDQMGGWRLEEYDYINYGCEWWMVKDATLEMADTRWRANCGESKDPRK